MRSVILLATAFLGMLGANWNDTETGLDLGKLPQFPLTKVRAGFLRDGMSVRFDGMAATAASGGTRSVVLKGTGRSGKAWEVHTFGLDEVWRGDLDKNGTLDYVLFAGGPYFNGRTTPLFSLSVLLMDQDRVPVPLFTAVYRGENGEGIRHIVDLDQDGRAEILVSSYDEQPSDPLVGPFCSGHWTHQLYRFTNVAAVEVRGRVRNWEFPLIHNWTYRGTQCSEDSTPHQIETPTIQPLATAVPNAPKTRIREIDMKLGFHFIDPVSGCNRIDPETIVYDRSKQREISFPSLFNPYPSDLADRIRKDGVPVELRGIAPSGDSTCRVTLLWASGR